MSRPSYALATRTKDKLGVVGQLVDGTPSVVVTATCRPRHWFIFICGIQFEVRSTNSSSDHTRSVTPAAIAGVTRSVLCNRTRL